MEGQKYNGGTVISVDEYYDDTYDNESDMPSYAVVTVLYTYTEYFEEHNAIDDEYIAATCTKNRQVRSYCTQCRDVIYTEIPGTALGHSWNSGIYTEPTYEADGFTTYTCTACGNTKVETNEGSKLNIGANLTWTLADGTLTISGTGAMYDYEYDTAPWNSNNNYQYRCIVYGLDGTETVTEFATLTIG